MFTLELPTSTWLRGDPYDSVLLRNDGKMCCLGIYLSHCGVSRDRLEGHPTPSLIDYTPVAGTTLSWFHGGQIHDDFLLLMSTNDYGDYDDETRVKLLNEIFNKYGINAVLVDR